MDSDVVELIICQGPPRCDLDGDEAIKAQQAGCVWCRRTVIHPDGAEFTTEPTSQ